MSVVGGKADEKGSKADIGYRMSVIPLITSVVGDKADIISRAAMSVPDP